VARLPNIIMVHEAKDQDESYLVAHYSLESALDNVDTYDKRTIGVYKLVGKRVVTRVPKVIKEIRVPK